MSKIEDINKMRFELFGKKVTGSTLASRRLRLKALVDEHGYEAVAAASGLSVASIVTYLRTKHPKIAETSLAEAEVILSRLK